MPWERDQPALAELRSSCNSCRPSNHPPLRPSLQMTAPRAASSTTFSRGFTASQEHLRHLVSPSRFAFCSAPLSDLRTMVRMPRAASLALARRPRLPMLPSGQRVHRCGVLWPRRASSAPCSPCAMLALPSGVRLPAGGRTLAGLSALSSASVGPGLCLLPLGCRLPAGNRGPALLPSLGWPALLSCAWPPQACERAAPNSQGRGPKYSELFYLEPGSPHSPSG